MDNERPSKALFFHSRLKKRYIPALASDRLVFPPLSGFFLTRPTTYVSALEFWFSPLQRTSLGMDGWIDKRKSFAYVFEDAYSMYFAMIGPTIDMLPGLENVGED